MAASEPIVIPPGEGETVGDSADRRVEILSEDATLEATWSRFGPGRDGADPHVHRQHTDFFYVLDGELTVKLGPHGDQRAIGPGALAVLPPMVVHGFRNASDAEVRYLNFHAPGRGFIDYMRSIRDGDPITYDQFDPPAEGARPTSLAKLGEEIAGAQRPGQRITLLDERDEIAIAEVTAEPGSPPSPPHSHDHVESIYVLDGELPLTLGDHELAAVAGTWVQVRAGLAHSIAAPEAPVRYLALHTPARGFGDFVRALLRTEDEERAAAATGFDLRPA